MKTFPDISLVTPRTGDASSAEPPLDEGLHRLLVAIETQRHAEETIGTVTPDLPTEVLARQLANALAEGHEASAASFATLLRAQLGLAGLHEALSQALARGGRSSTQTRVMARTAEAVLSRLQPARDVPVDHPVVVLASPPGDRHTLALTALSHQLLEAGHSCLVVDDVPVDDIADVLSRRRVQSVVVSAHLPFPDVAARRYFSALRKADATAFLVVGGPGASSVHRGPDLVTSDPHALLAALGGRANLLTEREREVLRDVADGLTNSEIAEHLGLSPATVRTHLDRVFAKTGTEHRAAAVARALRQGWIG